MKNRIILGLGFFWYIAGIACTAYLTAKLVDDFAFYQNRCPIPFVVVVIVGFLSCSIATGKLVIPLHFIYLKSLYWQKEYGGLPFTTYQQKLQMPTTLRTSLSQQCFYHAGCFCRCCFTVWRTSASIDMRAVSVQTATTFNLLAPA